MADKVPSSRADTQNRNDYSEENILIELACTHINIDSGVRIAVANESDVEFY